MYLFTQGISNELLPFETKWSLNENIFDVNFSLNEGEKFLYIYDSPIQTIKCLFFIGCFKHSDCLKQFGYTGNNVPKSIIELINYGDGCFNFESHIEAFKNKGAEGLFVKYSSIKDNIKEISKFIGVKLSIKEIDSVNLPILNNLQEQRILEMYSDWKSKYDELPDIFKVKNKIKKKKIKEIIFEIEEKETPMNEEKNNFINQETVQTQLKNDDWIYNMPNIERFKRYSQTGEEGYIDYIFKHIGYGNKFLVDIGAWDGFYLSNTRYFIENYKFNHLLIDGDNHGNEDVKKEWITKENICSILEKYNCPKEFSLLSYDTDGNDFDIIQEMCSKYRPNVIICEVNGTIPYGVSKKIQYNPNHVWNNDDYYGFSFTAGLKLAESIGYKVVFQNDSLNLYMVRKDLLNNPEANINLNFNHSLYHPHNPVGVWVEV